MLSVFSRQPNAALNLTVCPPRGRLVTCEVEARVSQEQKVPSARFETTKPQRNISRTLNGGVEDTKELPWCWKRRVRAAERSFAHLGRFQANLKSEVPVASLMLLTCMTSYLFHFRFTDAEQHSLRPPADGHQLVANDFRVRCGQVQLL